MGQGPANYSSACFRKRSFTGTPFGFHTKLLFRRGTESSCWDRDHLACKAGNVYPLALLRHSLLTLAEGQSVRGSGRRRPSRGQTPRHTGARMTPSLQVPASATGLGSHSGLGTPELLKLTGAHQVSPPESAQRG